MIIEISYIVYLVISIAMTIWVARTLSKNGLIFLIDSFSGNKELADSINHLLVVRFYLINFGYILLALRSEKTLETMRQAIEFLSSQVGFVLVILGLLHFLNILVISNWRNRALKNRVVQHANSEGG